MGEDDYEDDTDDDDDDDDDDDEYDVDDQNPCYTYLQSVRQN